MKLIGDGKVGFYAIMWCCGFECGCSCPKIYERILPGAGNFVEIESGPYHSQDDYDAEVLKKQSEWLLDKAKKYNCINLKEYEQL